ncbi:hypothetical protein FISHEDRAFT_55498 [Fistulina hepatica ATCC 64428]|uniref:Uncharacterized protein n=1 Tax=Fistulina hepatica ATCC 64428 TaxID=1128425 RepID=A0A0D7AN25_9AGAR|nr:hypothetical protein FISHEDRAFT_55498 [Fistulina hepatica ATCC 64428]
MDTSSSNATPKQPQPSQSDAAAFATDGPSIAATRPPEQPTSEASSDFDLLPVHYTELLQFVKSGSVESPSQTATQTQASISGIVDVTDVRSNVTVSAPFVVNARIVIMLKNARMQKHNVHEVVQNVREPDVLVQIVIRNDLEMGNVPVLIAIPTIQNTPQVLIHMGTLTKQAAKTAMKATVARASSVSALTRRTYIRDGHAHACDERHREYPYPPGPYPYEYDDYRRRPPPPGWERVPYPPSGWERVPRPMLGWEYGSPMWPGWEHPPPGWVPVDDWRRWERYPSPPVSYDQWGWPLPVWERPPPGYDVWGRPVYPGWSRMAPSTSVSAHGWASEERSRSTKRSSRSPTAAHGVLASAPVPATPLDIQPSPSASQAVGHQSAAEARQPPAIDGKAAASAEHAPPDVMRDTDEKAYSGWENRGKPIVVFGWDGEVTQADSPSANASAAEAEDGANCAASGGANPPTDGALANGPDSVAETTHPVVDVEKENSSPLVQQSVSTVDANETKLNVPSDVNASAALPQTAPSGTHAKTTLRSLASAAIPPSSPNITNGVPSTGAADGQTSVDVSAGSALDTGETVFSQAVVRCTGPLLEGVEQAASKYSVAAGGVVLTNDDGVQHAQEDGSVVVKDTAPTA